MHANTHLSRPGPAPRAWLRLVDCIIIAVAIVFIALACLGGCASFTPPPVPATQPAVVDHGNPLVSEFYAQRGGYLTAVQVATVARAAGKMDDKAADEFEIWRALFELTTLRPRASLAKPHVDPNAWAQSVAEQAAAEAAWTSQLPRH